MRVNFVILTMLCFVVSCNKETEIIQLGNETSVYKLINDGNLGKAEYFVVSNPPRNNDSLLSLVSKHVQSFAPDDTIKRYYYYNHLYYKETRYTPRDYKERKDRLGPPDDIESHRKDLLVLFVITPSANRQTLIFYKKGIAEPQIVLPWK
jgi:hypothetical protein